MSHHEFTNQNETFTHDGSIVTKKTTECNELMIADKADTHLINLFQ